MFTHCSVSHVTHKFTGFCVFVLMWNAQNTFRMMEEKTTITKGDKGIFFRFLHSVQAIFKVTA